VGISRNTKAPEYGACGWSCGLLGKSGNQSVAEKESVSLKTPQHPIERLKAVILKGKDSI
jgi:hypothetical protein